MIHSTIEFQLDEMYKSFHVEHNLDEYGLDIQSAFENWIVRTKRYTVGSFCKYVVSKDPINLICKEITKPQK